MQASEHFLTLQPGALLLQDSHNRLVDALQVGLNEQALTEVGYQLPFLVVVSCLWLEMGKKILGHPRITAT